MPETDAAVRLSEAEKVEGMTFARLRELGFTESQADYLILEGRSWHDADDLIARGCPVGLAFEILS